MSYYKQWQEGKITIEEYHKNISSMVMNVGLVVIVASGQVISNMIKIITRHNIK